MISIKDIWFKSEELTESFAKKSPTLLKYLKTALLFAICSVIFAGLLIVAGFFALMIKINERINPKEPVKEQLKEDPTEYKEHTDFSTKEPESQIEKMRKDGLM
tara:strand:+ start:412 stop:723 length:312 start_codon:yes stop_codon:yes gene_type:complete